MAKKIAGIFDSMSDNEDEFFTPSVNKTISKSAEPKQPKELTESDKKALRYVTGRQTYTCGELLCISVLPCLILVKKKYHLEMTIQTYLLEVHQLLR